MSAHTCPWCDERSPAYDPANDAEAEHTLCRDHLAEYMGLSVAGLDRMYAAERADMTDLGYFDR